MKNKSIVQTFNRVMDTFVSGEEYQESPPKGPPTDLPTLSVEELNSIRETVHGEKLHETGYSYSHIKVVEYPDPVEVKRPQLEELENLNICGIDGSNQRVEHSTFYFILARAAIVEFRYSNKNLKPYFYNKTLDASGVVWVDGNVFDESIKLHTNYIETDSEGKANILRYLQKDRSKPYLLRHDPTKVDKSPSSHALGWAVKLQQALELDCIKQVPKDIETLCIRDGPLFSTSVSPKDTINGLKPIFGWDDQVLIACSKRVKDSSLLVEAVQKNVHLRNHWFHNQNLSSTSLKFISTDSILLPRILKPGYRTPLMEAVPVSRKAVVEIEPRLMPLTCYYLSRHQPHTYIRLEIPRFMYGRDKKRIEKYIGLVCWQHEIGHRAPLVQLAADIRSQLGYEKTVLERQTISYLRRKQLNFPEDY